MSQPRPRPPRRAPRHCVGPARARRSVVVLTALALVAAGCAGSPDLPGATAAGSRDASGGPSSELRGEAAPATPEGMTGASSLVLVMPAADGLAPAERERVRLLVDRALDEVVTSGPRPVVLEPASRDAVQASVEAAVRRAGTVCVLGRDARAALAATLALYPARTGCLLPDASSGGDGPIATDVDLTEVGRILGASARAAAGDGTVIVLDGGDAMLDRRWTAGVRTGAVGSVPAGEGAAGAAAAGGLHVVATAAELLQFLDDQAASIAMGVVPGSREAIAQWRGDDVGGSDEGERVALALPPVEVVVLDASVESALLVDEVLARGLRVIAPRSLLAGRSDHPGVATAWRVRWDVALAALLRRVLDGDTPGASGPVALSDVLMLDVGPAASGG